MRPYLACLLAPILLLSTSGSYKSADPREAVRTVLDSIAADLVANNRPSLVARYDKRRSVVGNQIGSDGIEDGSNCLSGIRRLVGARGGQQEDGSQETGEVGSHDSLQVWTVVELGRSAA